jgi:cobalt-zinc-cadmium efflux system protein
MSDHDHGHAGHSHRVSEGADAKRLSIALALIVALIVGLLAVEVTVGILAHSLALLSDAAHMLTDAGALVMSLVLIRLMRRPSGATSPSGYAAPRFSPRRQTAPPCSCSPA